MIAFEYGWNVAPGMSAGVRYPIVGTRITRSRPVGGSKIAVEARGPRVAGRPARRARSGRAPPAADASQEAVAWKTVGAVVERTIALPYAANWNVPRVPATLASR